MAARINPVERITKYSLLSYVPAFLPQLDFVQLKDKNLTVNMLHVAPFIQILYLAKTDT